MEKLMEFKQSKIKKASFAVRSVRVKEMQPENRGFDHKQHYKIKLYLEPTKTGDDFLSLSDIKWVEYDPQTEFDQKDIIATNRDNNFAVELWAHDDFKLQCNLFLNTGLIETFSDAVNVDKS